MFERAKNGKPSAHPIPGDELRALRELQRHTSSGYIFETVNRLMKRIGERAGFPFKVHIHMLRHACGYALANAGHDTRAIQERLGHRAIQQYRSLDGIESGAVQGFLAHLI